jgi:hypothetical protein
MKSRTGKGIQIISSHGEKEMEAHSMGDSYMLHGTAFLHEKCRVLAGRLGIAAAVLLFIVGYVYGILKFGVLITIALGWLPCTAAAWLTAIAIASLGAPAIRHVILGWRQLSLLVRLLASA